MLVSETVVVAFKGMKLVHGSASGAVGALVSAPVKLGVVIRPPVPAALSQIDLAPARGGCSTSLVPGTSPTGDRRLLVQAASPAAKPLPLAKYTVAPSYLAQRPPVKVKALAMVKDGAVMVKVSLMIHPDLPATNCKLLVPVSLSGLGAVAHVESEPKAVWKPGAATGPKAGGQLLWSWSGRQKAALSCRARLLLATPPVGPPGAVRPLAARFILTGATTSSCGVSVMARGVMGTTASVQVKTRFEVKASMEPEESPPASG